MSDENAEHIRANVGDVNVERQPVPHFVSENTLPADCLADLVAKWPQRARFKPEVAGNYVLWYDRDDRDNPLRNLVADLGEPLSRAILANFADWIQARFGPDVGPVQAGFSLMEADPDYDGHVVHTHHYQMPHWLATALVYLDVEPGGHQGTTLCEINTPPDKEPIEYKTWVSLQSLTWADRPEVCEAVTADYVQNRMFAFLDSPISFHKVRAARTYGNVRRRVMRMHFSADPGWCEKLYGVTSDEYFALRAPGMPTDAPGMSEWNRREILYLETAPVIDAGARKVWADSIQLEF